MFVNLHTHSAVGSLLDSILTVDQMVKFAVDNGQPAIALTDHGYMSGFVDQVKICRANGIKPIVGCEIYEVDDYLEKNDSKNYTQPRYHLILLAAKQQGLQNLFEIVSEAATTGMYKKPRISISWIKEHGLGEGIICLTACQAGRLSRYLEDGRYQEAQEFVALLRSTFDYVACEIQSHEVERQFELNSLIYSFAKKEQLPYVITSDAHMLSAKQLDSHSVFVAIGDGRETGETYVGCHLQTEKDVYKYLRGWSTKAIIKQGVDEAAHIADMVDDDIDYGLGHGNIMPRVDVPPMYSSHEEYLRYLVFETFDNKFGWMPPEDQEVRRQRLERELPVINELDYTDYFIMLHMIAEEADKRGLPRGYSRGSGANCLCLFMLGVTQIDSVKWDLDFTRFANLGRKGSLADFDWDISKRQRKKIIEITEDLFGKENVAPIATFNTLSTKVAIRDIGKVLNEREDSPYFGKIPYQMRNNVAKMIPTVKTLNDLGEETEKDVLLKELVGKNHELDKIYRQFPLWFKYVMELEGLPKSRGRHAAGTLITPRPVKYYCPLCLDKDKNQMVQIEMHSAMDDLGLVKMDYLGLNNLDIVDDTLRMAGLTWQDVDINHLDLEDHEVYDSVYKTGNTVGIFQMESAEARKMCMDAKVDNINDIIVVNAANRPGTKDSFPDYCKNKLHPEQIEVIHPDLRELFKKTHCILLYQEDALHLFAYAGFDEVEQDQGRRSIGKKDVERMKSLEGHFRQGLKARDWNDEQVTKMWDLLKKQSLYSFNHGHSVAYGLLSYLTAYLKTHYPVEFMTALLTANSDRTEKMSTIINDCHRMGIKVSPPNINEASDIFTAFPDRKEIMFGFLAVKGMGENTVVQIIRGQPYKNFKDYLNRVQDKTATIALIKAGAFPTKDKMRLMSHYAKSLFDKKEYTPVKSLPTRAKLLMDWDIDVDQYKDGRKINKEAVLKVYNAKKKAIFDETQREKYKKYMQDFCDKYAQNEFLWEFQSLSMFLTNNPLEEAYELIGMNWEECEDGNKIVVPCVITDIKRKKDKNNNQFAYLDLCINNQIVEATIWSKQLRDYSDFIQKGSCICILGRKEEDHLFVESVQDYNKWLSGFKRRKGVK